LNLTLDPCHLAIAHCEADLVSRFLIWYVVRVLVLRRLTQIVTAIVHY
jgi:hypothetical protein